MNESNHRSARVQLQDRDFALLRGLFESRLMTADHIAALYFDGKYPYAIKRLRKIKGAGLIAERKRLPTQPSILFLTRKAFNLLNSAGKLSEYPRLGVNSFEARANVSERTLNHELEIMDVKAAFHASLAKSDKFALDEFSTWPLLHQFSTARHGHGADILTKPDGFIRIHENEEGTKGFNYDCFFELDRSSELQDALTGKAMCYRDFYQSGGFAVRNGASRADYEKFPFRVLIVLKSAERRNNTAERLAHGTPRILTQAWLTTLAEVTSNPLGTIWILPVDYRNVTKDTPFYNEQPNQNLPYRRQSGRDAFIEANIKKKNFFES